VGAAIQAGTQKYSNIKSPALAMYAVPKDPGPTATGESVAPAAAEAAARREGCMKAFEKVPSARIVRLPGANHYLFISNEAEVLKEMRDFIGGLKN
jgi:pimeloyl-ACP methyl ester carboxylesterase